MWLVHSTWNFLGHTWNNVSSCACPNSSERKNWKIGKAPVKGRYSDGLRTGELDASKYWRTWVQPWWRGGGWGACVSLITVFQHLKCHYYKDGDTSFVRMHGGETTHTFLQGKFHLDIRNIIFPVEVMKSFNKLSRGVVESPSLEISKGVLTEPWTT